MSTNNRLTIIINYVSFGIVPVLLYNNNRERNKIITNSKKKVIVQFLFYIHSFNFLLSVFLMTSRMPFSILKSYIWNVLSFLWAIQILLIITSLNRLNSAHFSFTSPLFILFLISRRRRASWESNHVATPKNRCQLRESNRDRIRHEEEHERDHQQHERHP